MPRPNVSRDAPDERKFALDKIERQTPTRALLESRFARDVA
jgi:hypothetical protein